MDIERLKELQGLTEQLYQDGNVPLAYCDDIMELIDEAIARQSVKSGETTSCEWCDPKTIPLFYAECVRATIDDESQLISVSYCPNCGRKIGEATEEIIVPAMTAEEENILRELAALFPSYWQTLRLEKDGDIGIFTDYGYCNYYFGFAEESSQAYEILAPILEKYGEINLEDYR